MKLVLFRHAPQNQNRIQALSEEGKKLLVRSIDFLKSEGFLPEYIYSSPSLRAIETAELIQATFHCPLEIEEALRTFDGEKLLKIVKDFKLETLVFVGHSPSISEFAKSLVSEKVPEIERACALVLHVDSSKRCLVSRPLFYITPDTVLSFVPKALDLDNTAQKNLLDI